jgi:magnesium-transporting ATPase (P-type)
MDPNTYNYQYSGNVPPAAGAAAFGIFAGMFLFFIFVVIAVYVFYAICLMKIANKTNTPNSWLAWIPIANLVLMLQIAKKPLWWIILFIIPLVNIVISILVWMGISKELGKPNWLGILIIIPIANLIIPAYLAFSKQETTKAAVI